MATAAPERMRKQEINPKTALGIDSSCFPISLRQIILSVPSPNTPKSTKKPNLRGCLPRMIITFTGPETYALSSQRVMRWSQIPEECPDMGRYLIYMPGQISLTENTVVIPSWSCHHEKGFPERTKGSEVKLFLYKWIAYGLCAHQMLLFCLD